ncbi:MAG: HAMP domain-containing sensor histidine kinase [Pseudomonadota bacterium]
MLFREYFPDLTASRHRYRFLGLSLIALLFAMHPDASIALRTLCIFLHFALILIWQPLWHSTTSLSGRTAAMLVACISGLVLWPGWLIITVWLLIIMGLLGGEHAETRINRIAQGTAMSCLFIILLLIVVPLLFEVPLGSDILDTFAFYAALCLAFLQILLPTTTPKLSLQQIDYLRALSITFFALLLASGSVLWMYRSQVIYTEALFQALIFIALLIIVVNWLWVSQSGHSIIQTLWNRYLLNLGTPFERYLIFLSESAQRHTQPDEFLRTALENLLSLDWVTGISWSDETRQISLGDSTEFGTRVGSESIETVVYSEKDVGPAFVLHIQLLVHLIEHFYFALQREAELETHLRMEAIHQTGSRLTHDIKNLLQSMHYLAAVVQASTPAQAEESLRLLQRQFPELRQRMQQTLEKLKKPAEITSEEVSATEWWQQLKSRYATAEVSFHDCNDSEFDIPRELFDNVAENLLENARYKQKLDRDIVIDAKLRVAPEGLAFCVSDSGQPIDKDIEANLFTASVPSRQGLGIGLFQSAQLAEKHGYQLKIAQNDDHGVSIELSKNSFAAGNSPAQKTAN